MRQTRGNEVMPRRVVVLGKGTLAIQVSEWFADSPDYDIVALVPVVPEPSWTDSLVSWAKGACVPYVGSGRYADIEGVSEEAWKVDLAISVMYDRIIKPWFIDKCARILNVHNGPLPRYRGVSPINWALKNGERKHGVTIHEITAGIDDGPIVAQLEFSIYPEFDEVIDVYRRALAYGWALFEQTMPLLDVIETVPQDESQATYHSRKEDHLLGERRNFTRRESEVVAVARGGQGQRPRNENSSQKAAGSCYRPSSNAAPRSAREL
jgi:methionyl-tRNA formyltransferase